MRTRPTRQLWPALLLGGLLLGALGGAILLQRWVSARPAGDLTLAGSEDPAARCRRGTPPVIAQACLDELWRRDQAQLRRGLLVLGGGALLLLASAALRRRQRA